MQKELTVIQLLPFKNISSSTTLFQHKGEQWKKTENKLPMYFSPCVPTPFPGIRAPITATRERGGGAALQVV